MNTFSGNAFTESKFSTKKFYDVIVVGGGAIGASIAWRLGQSGRSVLLLERAKVGSEASRAAAGMLGAQLEVNAPGPFFHLCIESRARYQDFARELLQETGIDVQLVNNGILHLANHAEEREQLMERLNWQQAIGARGQWWDTSRVAEVEPSLCATEGAVFLPDDGNISAPLLTKALRAAVYQRVEVLEDSDVRTIENLPDGARVITAEQVYEAAHVVVAAGAFAKPFLEQLGIVFHVYPVKGQMMSVRPRAGRRLRHTIFSQHAYLVPKADGSIVVGATEDHHSGFNRDVTVDAIAYLAAALERIAPDLKDAVFEDAWTGLRPGSASALPVIGPVPGAENVILAAGHFRNGILLAPVTADMVLANLNHEPWKDTWRSFLPEQLNVNAKE